MADYSEEIEAVSNAIAAVYENKQNKKNDLSGDFSNDNDSYPSVKGLKNLLSTYVPSSAIGNLLSGKIDVSDIVDNLITNNASKVLSAKQGKVLKDLIDALVIPSKTSELVNDSGFLTSHQSLTNYVQKSNTAGLIKNDGTIDTTQYLSQHQDITGKVNISDIKDNLTSTDTNKPLSARQGKLLKDSVDSLDVIKQATADTGYAATYVIQQNESQVGTKINIPVSENTEWGTFTELQALIDNSSNGDTIVLEKDYKNTDNINITISEKSLMIVGNGHILDGNNANCNIQLTGVVGEFINFDFENIVFTNFNYAITPNITSSYHLDVQNCIFINNNVGINNHSPYNTIENCVFINNTSYAIKSDSNDLIVKNCRFWHSPSPNTVSNYIYLTGNHPIITGKENTSNKVTSLSSSSTDTQYPSAKVVYDNLSSKANSNSFDTVTVTVTYTDNTSETVTLYKQPSS